MTENKYKFLRRGEGIARFGKISYPHQEKCSNGLDSANRELEDNNNIAEPNSKIALNNIRQLKDSEESIIEPSLFHHQQEWDIREYREKDSLMNFEALEVLSNDMYAASNKSRPDVDAFSFCTPQSCISGASSSSIHASELLHQLFLKQKLGHQNMFAALFSTPTSEQTTPSSGLQVAKIREHINAETVATNGSVVASEHVPSCQLQTADTVSSLRSVEEVNSKLPSVAYNERTANPVESITEGAMQQKVKQLEDLVEKLRRDSLQVEETRSLYHSKLKTIEDEMKQLYGMQKSIEAESLKLRHEKLLLEKKETLLKKTEKKDAEENKVLRREILELRNEACENESKWSGQRSKLKLQVDRLTSDLTAARSEIEKLNLRVQFLEKSNTRLETENSHLKVRLRNKQFTSIENDNGSEDKENSPASSLISGSKKEINDQRSHSAVILKSQNKPTVRFSVPAEVQPRVFADQCVQTATAFNVINENVVAPELVARTLLSPALPAVPLQRDISPYSATENRSSVTPHIPIVSSLPGTSRTIERKIGENIWEVVHSNGTIEHRNLKDGVRTLLYSNGDTKSVQPSGTVVHRFAATNTTQTLYPDGVRVVLFTDGQQEKHFPDGSVEARFPNGDVHVRTVFPSGESLIEYISGDKIRLKPNGDEICTFADGSVEERTKSYIKRTFPDGSVKTMFPDGSSETHFPDGRVRKKDANGTVTVTEAIC